MRDSDGFSNRVEGFLGWTDSFNLITIGTMIRLGLICHVATTVRSVRVRTFRPGRDLPYEVNADEGTEPRLVERIRG